MGPAMTSWRSSRSSRSKNSRLSLQESSQTSQMLLSPTVTARISGFRRAPWHVVQGTSRMYFSKWVRMVSNVVSWYLSKRILRTPENVVSQLVSRPSRVW